MRTEECGEALNRRRWVSVSLWDSESSIILLFNYDIMI